MKIGLVLLVLSVVFACGHDVIIPSPPASALATSDDDPYWCYRGMETPVMEGQPPPCPPPRDAGAVPRD